MIIVHSLGMVTIDNEPAGQVCDVIANHPKLASDVQRALVVYEHEQLDLRDNLISTHEEAVKTAQLEVSNLKETHAKEMSALGTKEEAQAIIKQKRIADLEERKAEIETQLAEVAAEEIK